MPSFSPAPLRAIAFASAVISLSLVGCSSPPAPCDACADVGSAVDARDASDASDATVPSDTAIDTGVDANPDLGVVDSGSDSSAPDADVVADTGLVTETWHTEDVTMVGIVDMVPSLALSADSRVIAWFDGNARRGRVARRSATGWSVEIPEDVQFNGYAMNVAFDASGGLRVLHHDLGPNDLAYETRDGAGTWVHAPVMGSRAIGWLARAAFVGDVVHSISVNRDLPHGISYVFGDGTSWTHEVAYDLDRLAPGFGIGISSQAIDVRDGRVYGLLVLEDTNFPTRSDALLAERSTSGVWTQEPVFVGVAQSPGQSDLVVDVAGVPHVCVDAWDGELLHLERVGGTWRQETIDPSSGEHFCAMAAGDDGRLHMVYGVTGSVSYRVRSAAGVWSSNVAIESGLGENAPIDLQLDTAGRPHVVYTSGSTTSAMMRYAWLGP